MGRLSGTPETLQGITGITERETLELQLTFEAGLWLTHKTSDERANHQNAQSRRLREQAMDRINPLLQRLHIITTLGETATDDCFSPADYDGA